MWEGPDTCLPPHPTCARGLRHRTKHRRPVPSRDRHRRPHGTRRPQIPIRLPAGLCSHLEAELGEHPGVSSSLRLLQDSCPVAARHLLAFAGGLRLGGSPPNPPADLCPWHLVVKHHLCRFSCLEPGPLSPQQGEGRPQRVDAKGRSGATLGSVSPMVTGCRLL